MARRMEIELTSARDDETFTWRAAGAKEPRGNIAKSLLSPDARPGDVLRVEADFELEGIVITAVLPSKTRTPTTNRIEIQAPPRADEGGVTTSLVERGPRRGRPRDGADRPRGRERPARTEPRTDRRPGPRQERERREPRAVAADRAPRPEREPARARRARPARLVPGTKHKDALFATLPPEQQPIAEQLAVGGLPAVRRALEQQQLEARAEGRPQVGGEAIISLAEQILPAVREAVWLDRAEAVNAQLDSVALRDLRATVVGASPHDEAGRELLRSLRTHLDERLAKLRATWEEEMAHALEAKRVLQALRLSSKPPEPSARFPAALVQPLAEAAGAALNDATPPDRYLQLLEAAAASPIRRSIKPAGIPTDSDGTLRKTAALAAGRIPALAPLLGLAMPPPPGPMRTLAPRRVPRRASVTAEPTHAAPSPEPEPEPAEPAVEQPRPAVGGELVVEDVAPVDPPSEAAAAELALPDAENPATDEAEAAAPEPAASEPAAPESDELDAAELDATAAPTES